MSAYPVQKRVDIGASPIAGLGANRAMWILHRTWPPVFKLVEAAGALPCPAFRSSEADQPLQQFVDRHAGRRCGEGDHRRRRIPGAADISLPLSTFMLFGISSA